MLQFPIHKHTSAGVLCYPFLFLFIFHTCLARLKVRVDILIIIIITGIVTRSLRKNLEAVPEKHSIDALQKTAILGTSHIIWKVLQCEA